MKPTRRQDLKTNELSQQIEEIRDYARENAAKLSGIFIVILVIAVGGYWYYHQRQVRIMDGWASLSRDMTFTGEEVPITVYESIADENLDPALTTQALLKAGGAALAKVVQSTSEGSGSGGTEDLDTARTAYEQVVSRFPDDTTAAGQAMVILGVIAEDQGNQETARSWYQKIIDDPQFESYPFREQASYRLAHLDNWSVPVVFPVPEPTVPEPPVDDTASNQPSIEPITTLAKPAEALQPKPADPEAAGSDSEMPASQSEPPVKSTTEPPAEPTTDKPAKETAPTESTGSTEPAEPAGGATAP